MRFPAALVLVLAAVLLPPAAPAGAARPACADTHLAPAADTLPRVRAAVLCLHNEARAERGLPALKANRKLRRAAERHSGHMVRASFFGHDAPGGRDLGARLRDAGYRGLTYGENIAWATGNLATAAQIHRAWMASPGHRDNILRRSYRDIGIGIALGAAGAGDAEGATYTADFGSRR